MKSLFASFSSEKEGLPSYLGSWLQHDARLHDHPPRRPRGDRLGGGFGIDGDEVGRGADDEAVGGQVSGWESSRPINEALGGEGFEHARAAMDALKSSKGDKYRRLSQFITGDSERDALLNLIYGLHDSLVQQVTERQWETIGAALELKNQEDVAARLGVQPSTVTRNLKRGHYWQMRETAAVVSALLDSE